MFDKTYKKSELFNTTGIPLFIEEFFKATGHTISIKFQSEKHYIRDIIIECSDSSSVRLSGWMQNCIRIIYDEGLHIIDGDYYEICSAEEQL